MTLSTTWSGLLAALPSDVSYLDEYGITVDGLQVYTRGECWYLAWTLHRLTGFELVALAKDDDLRDLYWAHVLVRLPDGQLLDVTGLQSEIAAVLTWSAKRRCALHLVSLAGLDVDGYAQVLGNDPQEVPAHFAQLTEEVAHHLLRTHARPFTSRPTVGATVLAHI